MVGLVELSKKLKQFAYIFFLDPNSRVFDSKLDFDGWINSWVVYLINLIIQYPVLATLWLYQLLCLKVILFFIFDLFRPNKDKAFESELQSIREEID